MSQFCLAFSISSRLTTFGRRRAVVFLTGAAFLTGACLTTFGAGAGLGSGSGSGAGSSSWPSSTSSNHSSNGSACSSHRSFVILRPSLTVMV
ncbi:hypothetical protein CPT_Spernnie_024 [Streptomyces phage Spernnie]|uniref:Uncharacterized protein n=1 Tax=Streptomyces phage Spernnie TaxID=2767588 RepID=A0A873WHM3_9CAUD|nr:hypothetical protein KGG74_gp24 [Streptomyces phage Spernnie]QPB09628.1 hypothetical protein CPT_Spernnie_024 [Streptomyces phage Spernnie]